MTYIRSTCSEPPFKAIVFDISDRANIKKLREVEVEETMFPPEK